MKKILVVVGTRPNFIKITRFRHWAAVHGFELRIVHTGQHSDAAMSDVFFRQLGVLPDDFLEAPKVSGQQLIIQLQAKLSKYMAVNFRPDLVMVVGDVNSTRAAAEAAQIHNIPIAHVESGLRSFDQSMPEEINRIVADNLATYFFITEQSGMDNLLAEGKPETHLYLVGNTMIDTLVHYQDAILDQDISGILPAGADKYILMTMHRPSAVDTPEGLQELFETLVWLTQQYPVVFPMHPRTKLRIHEFGMDEQFTRLSNFFRTEPLDYFSFQRLIAGSSLVITDSGGVQEETTFRKKPCLTLRPNTERPITISTGSNTLITQGLPELQQYVRAIQLGTYKSGNIPDLWDGKASERIFAILSGLR